MPTEFTLPELGENITAGDVVSVLVTVLMFVSPLFYPAEAIPQPFRLVIELGPLAEHPLELLRHPLLERIHERRVVPAEGARELVALDVVWRELEAVVRHPWRPPNRIVPNRTIVAPSSTATS